MMRRHYKLLKRIEDPIDARVLGKKRVLIR